MHEVTLEHAISRIRATRAGIRDLFDISEDVLQHLEAAGVISFDEDGQAAVTDIARGIFNEGCLISNQSLIMAETSRKMALATSVGLYEIIEFLKTRVEEDVLTLLVAKFADLGAVFEAAAPIFQQPIGSQPKAEAA